MIPVDGLYINPSFQTTVFNTTHLFWARFLNDVPTRASKAYTWSPEIKVISMETLFEDIAFIAKIKKNMLN